MNDRRFDPDDEHQEFELGKLMRLRNHPHENDQDELRIAGYWRKEYYRKQQSRWHEFKATMIVQITACDIGLDFDTMLLREILELLPLTKKKSVLKALLTADGRRIIKAARIVREELPEFVKKVGREVMA